MRGAWILLVLSACAEPARVEVTVHTGSALLVAVDPDGDGHWLRLPPQDDATFEAGPRWIAASVCGEPVFTEVLVDVHGVDDTDVTLPCRGPDTTPVPVTVTLVGVGFAAVTIGPSSAAFSSNGATVYAPPGTWSIYAEELAGAGRGAVVRDVVISDGGSVVIDFDADGFALEQRPVTATGAIGDVGGYATIALEGGTSATLPYSSIPDVVPMIPQALLRDRDEAWAHVSASNVTARGQRANVPITDAPLAVTLPPPLDDAAVSRQGATWTDDATWTLARFEVLQMYAGIRLDWTFTDPAAASLGEITFPDLAAIPGWDPSWNLDDAATGTLALERDDVGATWREVLER